MKRVTWTETYVKEVGPISLKLPRPSPDHEFYQDIAVLAVPETPEEADLLVSLKPEMSSGGKPINTAPLFDGEWETAVSIPNGQLMLKFSQPIEASGLAAAGPGAQSCRVKIEAATDGRTFKAAGEIILGNEAGGGAKFITGAGNFHPTKGRVWRLTFASSKGSARGFKLGWVALRGRPLVSDFEVKGGYREEMRASRGEKGAHLAAATTAKYPAPENILDLTTQIKPDGTLEWNAPTGGWTILRIGFADLRTKIRPSTEEATGLEIDKFSKEAVQRYFPHYPGKWAELASKVPDLKTVLVEIDSYEAGSMNWSGSVPTAFQTDHGYAIGPWLVALTGRVISSPDETDRFLWDLRQTFAGLTAHNYYGEMRRLCNERGMKLVIEPHGTGNYSAYEDAFAADEAWPEFWTGRNKGEPVGEHIASMAHTLGRTEVVASEAFTSAPDDDAWRNHPRSLKPWADMAFAGGINRMVYHASAHQAVPGAQITYGRWGVNMNRNNTWFPLSRGFHDYIARCGSLLQAGKAIADVLLLQDEGAPDSQQPLKNLADGYRFDYCAPSRLQGARVENREIILASGTRYRLLAIPPALQKVTPELAETIAGFVEAGLPLYGNAFTGSPSLAHGKDADTRVKAAVQRIWGSNRKNAFTKGPINHALAAIKLAPDLECVDANSSDTLFFHRSAGSDNLYFLANTAAKSVSFKARFRCVAPAVELWNPVDGTRRPATPRRAGDQRTELDISLPEHGSLFVIFGEAATCSGASVPTAAPTSRQLPGPWQVAFQPGRSAPERAEFAKLTDWSQHDDKGIRYFSGIATYTTTFDAAKGMPDASLEFDKIEVVADIELNGKKLGTLWTPPYQIPCGDALKAGKNELVVHVGNNWVNRMIGDEYLPLDAKYMLDNNPAHRGGLMLAEWPEWLKKGEPRPSGRVTLPTYKYWTKNAPLQPSGLIGSVRLCIRK